jgi:uncharacterized protein
VDAAELLRLNLLSPMVLAFALGVVATVVRSDLRFPDALYTTLSIYLLLAIGLKGGVALATTPFTLLWLPAAATLAVGVASPLWVYGLLRSLGRFAVPDAAAMAAHYGSVSIVTFIACQAFLDRAGVPYEGFMATLVALLEVPAILIALVLARSIMSRDAARQPSTSGAPTHVAAIHATATGADVVDRAPPSVTPSPAATPWRAIVGEVLAGRSIVLLAGGLVIGAASGPAGMARVEPFFVTPFEGVLTLFLLEMGLVTGRRLGELRAVGPFLLGFGVLVPLLHGFLGIALGPLVGLSIGGTAVLAVLFASASYLAATAAVRLGLPEANPSLYLTASLAITFPFNLIVGIPLYLRVAQALGGGSG